MVLRFVSGIHCVSQSVPFWDTFFVSLSGSVGSMHYFITALLGWHEDCILEQWRRKDGAPGKRAVSAELPNKGPFDPSNLEGGEHVVGTA